MKKVAFYSVLLIVGLVVSQFLPELAGSGFSSLNKVITVLTMTALAFIMIHVGYEFEIDKSNIKPYGWDYVVAMTAATFPWILVTLYFVFVLIPPEFWANWDAWKESLLAGRFAAPTSAGVLFSMLAAAGLSASWLFKKARILAIFDDLDTVLLMIPLKMLILGIAWQLGVIVLVMVILVWIAWKYLHKINISSKWQWVLLYSFIIVIISEIIHWGSLQIDTSVPIHLEVLLPAFVLGAIMKHPEGSDPHSDDEREGHQEGPESPEEQRVSSIISGIFMVLVGLSMPSIIGGNEVSAVKETAQSLTATLEMPGWGMIMFHVLMVTIISNIGKMFPAFCYRKEANFKTRLALAIGMWPRGEVGAGVLVVSIGFGIGGHILTVALLSLTLNLVLTGVFIYMVKRLVGTKA